MHLLMFVETQNPSFFLNTSKAWEELAPSPVRVCWRCLLARRPSRACQ